MRERVSCEAGPGDVEVSGGRIRRARPQEHQFVSGEKVKCRGHVGRVGFDQWGGVLLSCFRFSSRLHVLAAHDQVGWDLGLEDVGGGR
jgi:hypothetical protein